MGLLEKLGFRTRHVNGRSAELAAAAAAESGAGPDIEVLPVSVASIPMEARAQDLVVREAGRLEDALRSLPMAIDEPASARHQEQVELLRTIIAEHRAAGDCLDTALTRLAEQAEASLEARREMNGSMEATRLALAEVVRASERSATAIEQREAAGREADGRLLEALKRTRRTGAVLLVSTLACALAALGAAAAALVMVLR